MSQDISQSEKHFDAGATEHGHDALPTTAPISTAVIGGKTFVAGLYWQPLTRPRAYKKEAQEIGKREGMDVVAIRTGRIYQAGFAPKGQGASKGMYSLAAALAGKLGPSWIGVFEIDADRYAFVAVNDGAVVPGCDVIGDRESIQYRLRYYFGAGDSWEKIFAPADFDFGGETSDINELLAPGSYSKRQWSQYQLYTLAFGFDAKSIVRMAVFGVVVVGGLWAYNQHRTNEERKAREATIRAEQIRREQEEKLKGMTKAGQKAVLEHPWTKEPAVEDFVRNCEVALEWHSLAVGGWVFESASCDGQTVNANYRRKAPATVNSFIEGIAKHTDATPKFSSDQDSATLAQTIKILLPGDEQILDTAVALSDYGSALQQHGLRVNFTEKLIARVTPAPPLPGQPAQDAPPPPPDWRNYEFAFDTEESPKAIFGERSWAGMRLSFIEVKLNDQTAKLNWAIKGKIYAK